MIGELAALGTAVLWTVSAVLYKKAMLDAKPISANIVRCVCTGAILIVFLTIIGEVGLLISVPLEAAILAGVSGIIGLGFADTVYMKSLKTIGVARAVSITCTYPLFSILLAVFFQKEAITFPVILGAVVIAVGTWLLSQEGEIGLDELHKKDFARGVASALVAAVIWAVSITLMNMAVLLPEKGNLDRAFAVNTVRILAAAIALLSSAPITDRDLHFLKLRRRTALAVDSGGVVALALGWFLLAASFLYIPESQAVPISSTSPLFAVLAGMTFLREAITRRIVGGSALIIIGVFLIFMV